MGVPEGLVGESRMTDMRNVSSVSLEADALGVWSNFEVQELLRGLGAFISQLMENHLATDALAAPGGEFTQAM